MVTMMVVEVEMAPWRCMVTIVIEQLVVPVVMMMVIVVGVVVA